MPEKTLSHYPETQRFFCQQQREGTPYYISREGLVDDFDKIAKRKKILREIFVLVKSHGWEWYEHIGHLPLYYCNYCAATHEFPLGTPVHL